MTIFEKITRNCSELGRFLKNLPVLEAPWHDEFHEKFCAGCNAGNCDNCPHEECRNNPEWWLNLEVNEPPETVTKKSFVENELSALLIKADSDVRGAEYLVSPDGEEFVLLYFSNGHIKNVCVTADSLTAITRDVLKEL